MTPAPRSQAEAHGLDRRVLAGAQEAGFQQRAQEPKGWPSPWQLELHPRRGRQRKG